MHFLTEAPDVEELSRTHDLVLAADGAQLRGPPALRGHLPARRSTCAPCRYMWLGTDQVFDAFKFHIRRDAARRHAGARLPVRRQGLDVHRRDARATSGARRDSTPSQTAESRPGDSDEKSIEQVRGDLFADMLDGHEVMANNSTLDQVHDRPQRAAGAAATSSCSATPPTRPTSPSGPAPSSPWRTRSPSPPACTSTPTVDDGAGRLRGRAQAGRASTQRAAQASLEWFENLGQYLHQEPMQFAFNIMTRSRRVTYDNLRLRDPEFVGARRRVVRRADRGGRPGDVRPPMFQPFRLRRARRWPTGSWSRPWTCTSPSDGMPERLPPRPPGRQGARRRRPGDDRDGVRLPRGPDHPRLHRHLERRPGARPGARIVDFVHAETRAEDRHAARPLRPQGLDQAHVGGHGPAAATQGNWAVVGAVAAALPARRQPGAARADRRPTWRRSASEFVDAASAVPTRRASTCSSCTARTGTCCPRSSPR